MSSEIVGYIFIGIFAFIMLTSFLMGIKRGFKKSLFRLLWLVVCGVIIYFLTPTVSNYLNSFDLTELNINIFGPVHKLSDIGVNLLNSLNLDPTIASSPALVSFAQNLPTLVINIVAFVILFFVSKWILWIIWALLASSIFDKDKRDKKIFEKRVRELKRKGMPISDEDSTYTMPKRSKNRFAGGLVGIVTGLFICAIAFTPVIGLNAIYQNVYANVMTTNEQNEEVPYLSTIITDDAVFEYANSYENSLAKQLTMYSGVDFLSNLIFENVAVVEVQNQRIKFVDEVDGTIKAYNRYLKISDAVKDIDNISKTDIDNVISSVKELFFDIKDSKLIYVLGDDLLPKVVDIYVINNPSFKIEVGGVDYAELLKNAYTQSTENNPLNIASLQNQVDALADIALLLNNYNLAVPIIKGEVTGVNEIINLIASNVTNTTSFSSTLVDKLYQISLLQSQYPSIVDDAIKNLFSSLNIDNFESNKDAMSQEVLKVNMKQILSNLLDFLKYYNASQDYDFGENTQSALSSLGRIVDNIKDGILSSTSYQSFVGFLQTQLVDLSAGVTDLSDAVQQLSYVESWEDELRSLAPLYKAVIKIKNDQEAITIDKVFDGSYDISFVGSALLDVVNSNNSKLINNKNLRDIFTSLLDNLGAGGINDYLNIKVGVYEGGEDNRPTIKQIMLNNIWDEITGTTNIASWEDELVYSLDVIINIGNTFINFDPETISAQDNTALRDLGKSIDLALEKTHLFLSPMVLRGVFEYFIDNTASSLPAKFNEILTITFTRNGATTTVKKAMLDNIYDENSVLASKSQVSSWEEELSTIKVLFGSQLGGELSSVGKVLDDISTSKILSRIIVQEVIIHYLDQEVVGLDSELISNPLNIMKNIIRYDNKGADGKYEIKYEKEIEYLLDLVDTINYDYVTDGVHSANWVKFNQIGAKFNAIANPSGAEGVQSSKLLTKQVLNEFLAYYINNYEITDSGLASIVHNIPGENNANLESITNYQQEFVDLIELIEVVNSAELVNIGAKLDTIKLRSNIIPPILKNVINYYIDQKVPTGKDWSNGVISQLKDNVNNLSILDTSFEKEFGYFEEFKTFATGEIEISGSNSIGTFLDKLVGNVDGEIASKIITKSAISIMLSNVIENKITALTSISDGAKPIFLRIKDNVDDIENYTTEFGYLQMLIDQLNTSGLNKVTLGEKLDSINQSKLIKKDNIVELVTFYFNDSVSPYSSGEYSSSIDIIRNNIVNVTSFKTMFEQIDTLTGYLSTFTSISNLSGFNDNSDAIGSNLDSIETMSQLNGKNVAYSMANIMFNKLKTFDDGAYADKVETVKTNNNFASHLDDSSASPTYYSTMINALKNELSSIGG